MIMKRYLNVADPSMAGTRILEILKLKQLIILFIVLFALICFIPDSVDLIPALLCSGENFKFKFYGPVNDGKYRIF